MEVEAVFRAAGEANAKAARGREEELARRLDKAGLALSDAEARLLVESSQREEMETTLARDTEASRRREEVLGAAVEVAESARERAELKMEGAFAELRERDGQREVRRFEVHGLFTCGTVYKISPCCYFEKHPTLKSDR